jgi:hypothetical protein
MERVGERHSLLVSLKCGIDTGGVFNVDMLNAKQMRQQTNEYGGVQFTFRMSR